MAVYKVDLSKNSLVGSFSKDFEPFLKINSGDSIQFQTLDAGWGSELNGDRVKLFERIPERDSGHALCGPIYVNNAKKGMTLEIRINDIIPGPFGFTSAGQYPNWQNQKLQLIEYQEITLNWKLNKKMMSGYCEINGKTYSVALRPFLGVMGMPPDKSGIHSTWPPRYCGGNLDCKELIKGSTLYLPIPIDGGYFSVGDGHGTQGDGEISGQAIECPMELVDLTLYLREDLKLTLPRANTPSGWITFGFHEDLNDATVMAIDGMLSLMGELYGLNRVEATALGSTVIDLRITQIVNGVKGVHAFLPHGALR